MTPDAMEATRPEHPTSAGRWRRASAIAGLLLFLGAGAVVLARHDLPRTVSAVWEMVRGREEVQNFARFTLALTLLYTLGGIELEAGLIVRKAE